MPEYPEVERLVFVNSEDLKSILSKGPKGSAIVSVPDPMADESEEVTNEVPPEEDEPLLITTEHSIQSSVTAQPEVIKATRTDGAIHHAVRLIQRCYRRHRIRRELIETSEFEKLSYECAKDVQQVVFPWGKPKHRYRYVSLLRGPLPHVLFVLSRTLALIRGAKEAGTRRLSETRSGIEMEKCFERVRTLKYVRLVPECMI